jgi:hypothetical protein
MVERKKKQEKKKKKKEKQFSPFHPTPKVKPVAHL